MTEKNKTPVKLKPHEWEPIKESKGVYGYHQYKCKNCPKTTHIGLDIDYAAPLCKSDTSEPLSMSGT